MLIAEQISKGLSEFKHICGEQGIDAMVWTSIEIRMHPDTSAVIALSEPFRRPTAPVRDVQFSIQPPTTKLIEIFDCPVVLDESLPINRLTFGYEEVTHSIEITTPTA